MRYKRVAIKQKKKIFIAGDSMIKNITWTGISRDHTMKIRPHPGTINNDMNDYIKPELRHQFDVITVHCGTSDIRHEIQPLKNLKRLLKEIEGYDMQEKPNLITRYDQNFNEDIKSINEIIQSLCTTSKGFPLLTIVILITHV